MTDYRNHPNLEEPTTASSPGVSCPLCSGRAQVLGVVGTRSGGDWGARAALRCRQCGWTWTDEIDMSPDTETDR